MKKDEVLRIIEEAARNKQTELSLSWNKLKRLPAEIAELKNLTKLDLSYNELKTFPAKIVELKNLTELDLSANELKTLPAEIGKLKNLTTLDLSGNQLTSLPTEIVELKNLTTLDLLGNPLESPPPEIAEQGIEAIFCLAKRLIYDKFIEDKSTEGIDILKWVITAPTADEEEIKLNVWDFGGQEIYHATHQFFLTKRSVYLLVWNARKSQDFEHIYYWLHTIEAFGEDSPIVLVLSKLNERDDDLNMRELRKKFPQIVGLYKIDSEDGKGIPSLKDIISETAWHLPHMRTPWVESWYTVRERLENDEREWIEYTEFEQICKSEGLSSKQTDILDEYLHYLGVIIHFRDRLGLRDMVILNPEWATKAVYKILDTQSILDQGGILLHSELDQIWNSDIYPQNIFSKLLGLMNKFELAFELPDKKSHLIAELLPKTEPELEWNETNNLRFYYHYDFLPAGVITRFIVLMHEDLEDKPDGTHLCWREGAVLQREGTRALVKVKPLEKLIEIKINGSKKRELLAIIRNQFDHINSKIKKVKITEEIPCNCSEGCPHRFDYIQLLKAENKGKVTVDCPESWEEVQVSALLDGFVKKKERKDEYEKIPRGGGDLHIKIEQKQENIQKQEVKQDVKQDVKVKQEVKINLKIDIPAIQSEFADLRDLMRESNPDSNLERKLKEIGDSLDEVSAETEKEKLNKPLNKVGRFLKELEDKNSKYHKIVSGTKKGIVVAQTLGKTYNKFAQWLALPQVPDLFLGK
jgi:GTPase SAR1 family protein